MMLTCCLCCVWTMSRSGCTAMAVTRLCIRRSNVMGEVTRNEGLALKSLCRHPAMSSLEWVQGRDPARLTAAAPCASSVDERVPDLYVTALMIEWLRASAPVTASAVRATGHHVSRELLLGGDSRRNECGPGIGLVVLKVLKLLACGSLLFANASCPTGDWACCWDGRPSLQSAGTNAKRSC